MATLPGLVVDIVLNSATFIRESRRIDESVNRMGRNVAEQNALMARGFGTAATAFKSLAAGFGIGFGVTGFVNLVKGAIDSADRIGDLAARTGVAASALQALQHQAQQTGSSAEAMASGLETFAKNVGQAQEGIGRLAKQLQVLDPIAAKQIQTARSQEEALRIVAEAIERADTTSKAAAISVAAFGGAGVELAAVFRTGAEGIDAYRAEAERLGIVLDDDLVAAAQHANDEIDRLTLTVGTKFSAAILSVVKAINLLAGVSPVSEQLAHDLAVVQQQIKTLNETGAQSKLGRMLHLEDTETPARMNELLQRRASILNELRREADRSVAPVAAMSKADRAAAEAQEEQVERLKDVGKFLLTTSAQEERYTEATRERTKATQELVGAQKRLQEAGKFLTETSAAEERAAVAAERQAAAQKTAATHQEFTRDLRDQLSIQQLLLSGVDKESEQYRIHVALLDAKRRLGRDLTAEEERMIRLLEQQGTQIDKQNEFASGVEGVWASPSIDFEDQEATVAMLEEILSCR